MKKKIKIENNNLLNWKIELITIFILFMITIVWQIISGFIVIKKEKSGKKILILLIVSLLFFLFAIIIFAIVEIILGFVS
ncbi:hypothetical protein [Spiroplasma citri]|uniref:hypothetical protein n=1 Tax=Spiroplasma citri TaxID=2133 RepID=UPI0013A0A40B|nr:hypothetical protein [Spiroplasma citri]QIA67738.1 hypothetical protein GMI18_09145 [Spiroplasma citri]